MAYNPADQELLTKLIWTCDGPVLTSCTILLSQQSALLLYLSKRLYNIVDISSVDIFDIEQQSKVQSLNHSDDKSLESLR